MAEPVSTAAAAAAAKSAAATKGAAAGKKLAAHEATRTLRDPEAAEKLTKALIGLLVGLLMIPMLVVVAFYELVDGVLGNLVSTVAGQFASNAAPWPQPAPGLEIPAAYWSMYITPIPPKVNPYLTASIHKQETGFSTHPSARSGRNSHGCCAGPMQFNIDSGTWDEYKNSVDPYRRYRPAGYPLDRRELPSCKGVPDHEGCIYDDYDAIIAGVEKLTRDGADKELGSDGTRQAVLAYNRSSAYANQVISRAQAWEETSRLAEAAASTRDGPLEVRPGANRPGVELTPLMTAYLHRMAQAYQALDGPSNASHTLTVTTGTQHDRLSSSGNVSDHWAGNGADFGTLAHGAPKKPGSDPPQPVDDHPSGDRIATAAFMAADIPLLEALTRGDDGGSQTVYSNGVRVQIIWKSDVGGNHHNHVHVGLKP